MIYVSRNNWLFSFLFMLAALYSCSTINNLRGEGAIQRDGIEYLAEIRGIEDVFILRKLESLSETISPGGDLPPTNRAHLAARAERDLALFIRILRSEGYYGAKVSYAIEEKDGQTMIIFTADPGPAYTVEEISVAVGETNGEVTLPEDGEAALKVGSRITAREVISLRDAVLKKVRSQGFPFARIEEPYVTIDHSRRTAAVRLLIKPGPAVRFGAITVKGLTDVNENFVRKLIAFRENDTFNPDLLQEARSRLLESGLFSTANISPEDSTDADGRLPVTVEVTERKHRSVMLGLSYRSDERFGAKASWEDRNLRGNGERLSAEARASGVYSGLETSYLVPVFNDERQRLKIHANLSEQRPDAFTSRAADLRMLLERRFHSGITAGAAAGLKVSRVEQQGTSGDFTLFSIPLNLSRDTSDDVFDPRAGAKTVIQLVPVHDLRINDLTYLKTAATATRYLSLQSIPGYVLAGRVSAATILGRSREGIPADERFYAGGGGSIRGYAFQSVGPLSASGSPLGGISLLEASLELRAKLTERIGLVFFADGGSSFSSRLPLTEENLRWGCGFGIRYYTPLGPLRADIGVPLERREGLDEPYQFYVSIGQAF